MKHNLATLLSLLYSLSYGVNPTQLKRYPYSLLTPDFGILFEKDLKIGAGSYQNVPYDPRRTGGTSYWKCFPSTQVSFTYKTWRDADSMGPSDVIVTMCSFDIQVKDKDQRDDYSERRANQVRVCKDIDQNWKRLTLNEPHICLFGENGFLTEEVLDGTKRSVTNWTWKSLKTRKGCYAYFGDDCAN